MVARCHGDRCWSCRWLRDTRWVAAPPAAALRTDRADGAFRELSWVLSDLVERHAVSGHEWSVRRAVLASLPAWAQDRAVVDDIGNIMVEAGPPGPATVFMAHMDEVGYRDRVDCTRRDRDAAQRRGARCVRLGRPDGARSFRSARSTEHRLWPGRLTSIRDGRHSRSPQRRRRRCVAFSASEPPRRQKNPGAMQAWFGLDAEGLAARGVVAGMQVTSHKEGLRLGRTRYTARSLDDRAGTTALLRAIRGSIRTGCQAG